MTLDYTTPTLSFSLRLNLATRALTFLVRHNTRHRAPPYKAVGEVILVFASHAVIGTSVNKWEQHMGLSIGVPTCGCYFPSYTTEIFKMSISTSEILSRVTRLYKALVGYDREADL